jgi:hypothetical protein
MKRPFHNSICRVLHPLAMALLLSGSLSGEPVPETRITDIFGVSTAGMRPADQEDFRRLVTKPAILETESTLALAETVRRTNNGMTFDYWDSVTFMNPDGSGEVTRKSLASYLIASFGSFACKSRVFLNSGTGYVVVDRDPAVPNKFIEVGGGSALGAVTDEFVILHTRDAKFYGTDIRFLDAKTLQPVGTVTTKVRTARVAASQGQIFLASETGGKVKLHRMAYPDFSGGSVVKAKLSNLPGTYSWVEHFSPNFAVVTDLQGREILVRWSDPAKGGKPSLFQPPAGQRQVWFEAGGRLGVFSTYPELTVSHVTFGNGSYTFEPAGVPKGFRNCGIHSIGPDSVFFTAPTSNLIYGSPSGWTTRVRLAPGRQLFVDAPVAEERDGQIKFKVSLDRPSVAPVTFDYQTADRSAVAGEDFSAISGTATIAPGETGITITVPLLEDHAIEGPETFEFQITGLSGAFCDNLVTPGRIRGSGMRVVEVVDVDDGSVLPTLDGSLSRTSGVPSLAFAGGTVNARDHGFEYFIPIAGNGGSYHYARGHRLGSDSIVLCQFDPARGELTEIFTSEEARKRDGDQFILKNGNGYVRYGFFDGLPVLSLEGLAVAEGGGAQTLAVRSERTLSDLDFSAAWADPSEAFGPISFSRDASGDILFHIDPPDDGRGGYDLEPGVVAGVSAGGFGGSQRTAFSLSESKTVATVRVGTASRTADGLVASGNRVWLCERGATVLEGLKFESGALLPAGTAKMPPGAVLDWAGYYNNGYSGQGLAFDGSRLLSGYRSSFPNLGAVAFANASSTKPAAKLFKTGAQGGSRLAFSSYLAIGESVPTLPGEGVVQIVDVRSNKQLKSLKAPIPEPSFGHSLAFSGDTLWISAPRPGGGKVYGFKAPGFTPVATLTSPVPVANGLFGYSIAGSSEHLIVGEPSSRAPGAAWVYPVGGGSVLKRLDSGAKRRSDGFGARVAARNGRLMVGSARITWELNTLTTTPQIWPVDPTPAEPDGTHYPVLLWEDLDAPAIQLKSARYGLPDHASGGGVALLDDGAVFPSRGPDGGGLEFHRFGIAPD